MEHAPTFFGLGFVCATVCWSVLAHVRTARIRRETEELKMQNEKIRTARRAERADLH